LHTSKDIYIYTYINTHIYVCHPPVTFHHAIRLISHMLQTNSSSGIPKASMTITQLLVPFSGNKGYSCNLRHSQ